MDINDFLSCYQFNLTSQQKEAVSETDGPLLLLAVPGSGKTTVLVIRLGYMIYGKNINPENILVLTYTVSATRDMSERFSTYFGDEYSGRIEFRTINGICAKIIMYCSRIMGQTPLDLIEEKDTMPIISAIIRETTDSFPTEADIKAVKLLITYIKNMMLKGEEIKKLENTCDYPIAKIYETYNKRLRSANKMDYDDQMIYALTLLKRFPDVLAYYQNLYPYIMVDEAQDTSKIQHEIIKLLASKYDNLFMVGDEDQSIYGFRAAYPEAILNFALEHRNAKVLLMEENFRSSGNIVRCASEFINKNITRHPKNMLTHKGEGASIREIVIKKRSAQYAYLLKVSENIQSETAVLYRDNESAIPLIDMFERNHISYRLVGSSRDFVFFSNRIVMDIVNVIRFAYDPYNTEIFMQIYYKIGTYLKKEDASAICRESEQLNVTVMEAALRHDGLAGNVYGALRGINTNLANIKSDRGDKAIFRIMNVMGYSSYLERSNTTDSKSYILEALGANEPTAMRLLFRLEELQEIIKNKQNDYKPDFILSTIHSSKGLEYDTVYLLDVEDGLFPEKHIDPMRMKYMNPDDLKAYEEERRLFYVAITRAKNTLNLFSLPNSSFCREALGKDNKSSGPVASKGKPKPIITAKRSYKKNTGYNAGDIYKDKRKRS